MSVIFSPDRFIQIVQDTPLVSVDILLIKGGTEVLLGLRNNRPAQGCWFVPGGRIVKDEPIANALVRVVAKELSLNLQQLTCNVPVLKGVYEHMYQDCFAGDMGISTHYVVLAYQIDVGADFALPVADEQHAALKWWPISDALASRDVHQYTKNYFLKLK